MMGTVMKQVRVNFQFYPMERETRKYVEEGDDDASKQLAEGLDQLSNGGSKSISDLCRLLTDDFSQLVGIQLFNVSDVLTKKRVDVLGSEEDDLPL